MTTATCTAWRPRWAVAFLGVVLASVLAVAVGLFIAGPVSALTASAAQNAVGASHSGATVVVGASANITAGQRLGHSPLRPQGVVATGVAANSVPTRLARVVPEEFGGAPTLGRPGTPDVFVTAADDLAGISTSSGMAERLTLLSPGGKPISGPFRVLEFDTPAGIASPIRRTNPGFIGGGRTAGGAREFVIPN